MLRVSLLSFLLSLMVASCSHIQVYQGEDSSQTAKVTENSSEEMSPSTDDLYIELNQPFISAQRGPSSYRKSLNEVYFLEGADNLKLENYHFDIPVVYNEAVKKWVDFYLTRGRSHFERYCARAGRYAPIMGKILQQNGLPRDFVFMAMAESGFINNAKSWASATGPWQFMSYTGKQFGLEQNFFFDERRDPIKATKAAAQYLKYLYDFFDGDWELATAAYNAGEGKVSRAVKRYKTDNFWELTRYSYLKKETKEYVPKIMAMAIVGKNLKHFGFNDIDFHSPLNYEEVKVAGGADLYKIAASLGTEFSILKKYNPELLRWYTPLNKKNYTLRLPKEIAGRWDDCCSGKKFKATDFKYYKIKKYASMSLLSKKFRTPVAILSLLNRAPKNKLFKKGELVKLPYRKNHSVNNKMYADLRPAKTTKAKKQAIAMRNTISRAKKSGKLIKNPNEYYVVKKGDTLWDVSRKKGVSMNTLIRSNLSLLSNGRSLQVGDRLIVR